MNYYTLLGTGNKTKAEYKALLLMYLTSPDFDVDFNTTIIDATTKLPDFSIFNINAHLPFSLSNLGADKSQLLNPVYLTEFQSTREGFDKPIVEADDIVLAVVDSGIDLGHYYNDYSKFNLGWTANDKLQTIYIGISNSSKSQFNEPFAEANALVIASQLSLDKINDNYSLTIAN